MSKEGPLARLMKEHEHSHRRILDPRSYVLVRLDGRAFHTYTRGLKKPFDLAFLAAMDRTSLALCEEVPGIRLAYTQSDEISLLITAFKETSEPSHPTGVQLGELWIGGVEAKITSLTAALATTVFNEVRRDQARELDLSSEEKRTFHRGPALFDSRVWTFPGSPEGRELVDKYFTWRHRDAVKNSVTMAASSVASHRELQGMKTDEKLALLEDRGRPWESFDPGARFGRHSVKTFREELVEYTRKDTGETHSTTVTRGHWDLVPSEDLGRLLGEAPIPMPLPVE